LITYKMNLDSKIMMFLLLLFHDVCVNLI